MSELYFKPTGGTREPRNYPRATFEAIVGTTEPGEWFLVVEFTHSSLPNLR